MITILAKHFWLTYRCMVVVQEVIVHYRDNISLDMQYDHEQNNQNPNKIKYVKNIETFVMVFAYLPVMFTVFTNLFHTHVSQQLLQNTEKHCIHQFQPSVAFYIKTRIIMVYNHYLTVSPFRSNVLL